MGELKPLSQDDREFLADLQRELLTQDHDCQAAPRFWVVRDKDWETCWEENAERTALCCCDGEVDIETALECLGSKLFEDESDEEKIDAIIELGNGEYWKAPVRIETRIVPNTMFLTKREAQEYIRIQRHNLRMEPHTYAMGTYYSTQVERLLELLETTDWNARWVRTCQMLNDDWDDSFGEYKHLYECGICSESTALLCCINENGDTEWVKPKFCGNCGAKVVER